MKVKIEFVEKLLGTMSGDKEVATDFIADKHPKGIQKDERQAIENLDETMEKSSTVFPRTEDGKPFVWDYQLKGYFKQACLQMIMTDTMTKEELKKVRLTDYLHKKTIDLMIFPSPRRILLQLPDGNGEKLEFLERPLRGQTRRGERIALARSEIAPVGTIIEFEILTLNKKLEPFIPQWLDAGIILGTGQWRSGGYGRFTWTEIK